MSFISLLFYNDRRNNEFGDRDRRAESGAVETYDSLHPNPTLRRESRIKSIHSSLAIEQNTLTLEQVSDVIEGKRVLGPPQDIREVKNAYEAYERVSRIGSFSVKNLLLAHRIMMDGLVKGGRGYSGVRMSVCMQARSWIPCRYSGKLCAGSDRSAVYLAEAVQAASVSEIMYFFIMSLSLFIPSRMEMAERGRLWQSLILQKWKPFFAWLPCWRR